MAMLSSKDMRHFKFEGFITGPGFRNTVLFPEKINGLFTALERPNALGEIWVTQSPDLKFWGSQRLLMSQHQCSFGWGKIGPCGTPIRTDKDWLIIFHAVSVVCDYEYIYNAGVALGATLALVLITNALAFSSTGSVYGEPEIFPTPENAPFPVQTSLYGASKLAGEGLIQAYCEGFGFQSYIFRFVSILGERYSHGHVFDFYRSLRGDPSALTVLGDGHQRKSYLHVTDCLDAMLLALERATCRVNVFNLGTDEYCEVNDSIGWITGHLGVRPTLTYTGGDRGWIGDSPFIFLDCARVRAFGWRPRLSIREGVIRTVEYLQGNSWLLEARA